MLPHFTLNYSFIHFKTGICMATQLQINVNWHIKYIRFLVYNDSQVLILGVQVHIYTQH